MVARLYLDMSSQSTAGRIPDREILDKESVSDHPFIVFHLDLNMADQEVSRLGSWNIKKLSPVANAEALEEMRLLDLFNENHLETSIKARVERVAKDLVKLLDRYRPKRKSNMTNHSSNYWWSESQRRSKEISRGSNVNRTLYKVAKQTLKKVIKNSKGKKWQELLNEVDSKSRFPRS